MAGCNSYLLTAIGEFKRERFRERTMEGREKAMVRGAKFGAKPKLTNKEIQDLIKDFESPGCSKKEIANHYGIARSTVYKLYAENRQKAGTVSARP